jgi:hypothetical protein
MHKTLKMAAAKTAVDTAIYEISYQSTCVYFRVREQYSMVQLSTKEFNRVKL